jgi:hypothetical protein
LWTTDVRLTVTGKIFSMEPGYSASLTVSCTLESGVSLASGTSLTLLVTCPINGSQEFDLAMRHGVLRDLDACANAGIGPQLVAVVATLTFTVDAAAH